MAICEVCPVQGTLRCSGCNESHYCSKLCQKEGWFDHKHLRKTLGDFRTPPPPTKDTQKYIRAIYFPTDGDSPRFEWLSTSDITGDYTRVELGSPFAITDKEKETGRYEVVNWEHVNTVIGSGRHMDHTIRIHYRTGVRMDLNEAISKITYSRSQFLHNWKGPVVAYGIAAFTSDSHVKQTVDLVPADLRKIVKFFNTYHLLSNPISPTSQLGKMLAMEPKKPREHIECVRVNCEGDVQINKRPRFESIRLLLKHAVFAQNPLQIPQRIELPLVAARIPGSVEMWKGRDSDNTAASSLFVNCTVANTSFGVVPTTWNAPVGSFLIARCDKAMMPPEHVAGLVEYYESEVAPLLEKQRESGSDKNAVLECITKANFEKHYTSWRTEQLKEKEMVPVLPSRKAWLGMDMKILNFDP